MNIDELMDAVAERFTALGAGETLVADLRTVRGQCIRILDKYSRFTPIESEASVVFQLDRTFMEGSEFVAQVSLNTPDGDVPAAVVRYSPE